MVGSHLQVQEHTAGHVLAGAGFREEGVEGIVATADGLVRRHLPIRLDTVLQAVQFPTGISDLDTCKTTRQRSAAPNATDS